MELMSTSIPTDLSTNLRLKGFDFPPASTFKMYDTVIKTFAQMLSLRQSKDHKTAVVCRDLAGNLVLAAIVEYHPVEDSDETVGGNWSFTFTLKEEDLEGAVQFLTSEEIFKNVFSAVGVELYNMRVIDGIAITEYVYQTCISLLDNLKANAKEGQTYTVEEPNYFIASSTVENGEILISIVPDEPMKDFIKDDKIDEA